MLLFTSGSLIKCWKQVGDVPWRVHWCLFLGVPHPHSPFHTCGQTDRPAQGLRCKLGLKLHHKGGIHVATLRFFFCLTVSTVASLCCMLETSLQKQIINSLNKTRHFRGEIELDRYQMWRKQTCHWTMCLLQPVGFCSDDWIYGGWGEPCTEKTSISGRLILAYFSPMGAAFLWNWCLFVYFKKEHFSYIPYSQPILWSDTSHK